MENEARKLFDDFRECAFDKNLNVFPSLQAVYYSLFYNNRMRFSVEQLKEIIKASRHGKTLHSDYEGCYEEVIKLVDKLLDKLCLDRQTDEVKQALNALALKERKNSKEIWAEIVELARMYKCLPITILRNRHAAKVRMA